MPWKQYIAADVKWLLDYSTEIGDIRPCLGETSKAAAMGLYGELTALGERDRIAATKVLLAMLPESEPAVLDLLGPERDVSSQAWECRFTLFCYLDQVPPMISDESRLRILSAVEQLAIRNANDADSSAKWMFRHMLEDHWPYRQEAAELLSRLGRGNR